MADMSADDANAEQCNRNGNQALASEQLMEVTAPPPAAVDSLLHASRHR